MFENLRISKIIRIFIEKQGVNKHIYSPLNDVIMFALFFLYALIIAAVVAAVVLVLKIVFWALMFPILWIGFSIANAIDRRKKVARQRR